VFPGLERRSVRIFEQQTATTAEMSRNVSEVAVGSADISANVSGVAQAAAETTGAAANTEQTSADLARVANALQTNLARFRYRNGAERGTVKITV
jgi:methyl-accepting chemotaxis protein